MDDELTIRLKGADHQPLEDRYDLDVLTHPQKTAVANPRELKGTVILTGLLPFQTYHVTVWPMRHRPVSAFTSAGKELTLFAPLMPERVTSVRWGPTPDPLSAVVTPRQIEVLQDTERAGLLNIYAKLATVDLWRFVLGVYDVRPDRIFAHVQPGLRDMLLESPDFASVDGSLHPSPEGFCPAGSWKHRAFKTGVLQVTLFSDGAACKADIDIDDAGGVGHLFQVLGHALTNGCTHPYDIHQILTFHQKLDLGYNPIV